MYTVLGYLTENFVYIVGVDDAESECGLDDVEDWDFIIENNDTAHGMAGVDKLYNLIQSIIS